jgi:hypothetical protein
MRKSFLLPPPKTSWTDQDVRTLRDSAAQGMSLSALCRILGKTPSAIRNKAALHGIALSQANRTR